jgi:V/A-type H+-transporting ATPase subunit A
VDGATPAERQQLVFDKILEVLDLNFEFEDKSTARQTMVRGTDLFRNWNYAASDSEEYQQWLTRIDQFIATKGREQ